MIDGEVHVWVVPLTGTGTDDGLSVLNDSERRRAGRFRFPVDRDRFVARRAALRAILADYTGLAAPEIGFEVATRGRPSIARHHGVGALDFNLTHSGDLALVAVSSGRVGVDVERLDGPVAGDRIGEHWFAPSEVACIAGGCAGTPTGGFFRHWTAKEAYLKADGCGLAGLRDVVLDCATGAIHRAGEVDRDRAVVAVDVSPEHAAAVVTAVGTACEVRRWPPGRR